MASIFLGGLDGALTESVISGSAAYQVDEDWSVQLAAGAILDGALELDGAPLEALNAGFTLSAGGRWRALSPEVGSGGPFIDLAVAVSIARTETTLGSATSSLWASDVRFSTVVGRRLWESWTPYIAFRLFGGPIFWERGDETQTGTDRYHFQFSFGSSLELGAGVSAYIDVSPGGERSVSTGLSISFSPEPEADAEEIELPVAGALPGVW